MPPPLAEAFYYAQRIISFVVLTRDSACLPSVRAARAYEQPTRVLKHKALVIIDYRLVIARSRR